jgi:outer membrane protein
MTLRRLTLGWLAAVVMGTGTAGAEPPPATGPSPLDVPALHGTLALSLPDALRMGLENNLDVQVERYAPFIAQQQEREAWGSFDPLWSAEAGYANDKDPNANVLLGTTLTKNKITDGKSGFSGMVPMLGATYDVSFEGSRRTTNTTIEVLSPELRSGVSAQFVVPLLRDLIWNEPWTRVKTNRVLYETSEEAFRTQVMNTVQRIADGYWNLIAAHDAVGVADKSLETAKALLDQTRTQHEVGVVSKVEVVEAEAGVAAREFDQIVAENRYRNAQDQLIDLVLGPHLAADSTLEIDPTDRPEDFVQYDIDPEVSVERAFENRPELAVADKEIERNEIQLKFAKNQRLPRLDAIIGYGPKGLAGSQNPSFDPCRFLTGADKDACELSPPTVPSTDFGDTFDVYSDASEFTARGMFSIPIPNTGARSRVSQAQLELRRSMTRKRRLEQSIILEVRKAVRDLKSAQEGIEAAQRGTVASGEQLRAEKIRLEYGESTPFDVLLRESDYVDAESQEINAFQVYRTSATALDRAQGTILRSHNIAIDQVRELR